MSEYADLIKAIAAILWPILGFVAVFLFKVQIRELFGRLIKGKFLGQELELVNNISNAQQTQVQEVSEGVSKKFTEPVSGLLPADLPTYFNNQVESVRADLLPRNLSPDAERELLMRALAATQILQHFERLARLIFGSQLQLLVNANSVVHGVPLEFVREAYNTAVLNSPEQYRGMDFERWLGFLTSNGLVTKEQNQVVVAPKGRDFMKYLVDNHDTAPRPF